MVARLHLPLIACCLAGLAGCSQIETKPVTNYDALPASGAQLSSGPGLFDNGYYDEDIGGLLLYSSRPDRRALLGGPRGEEPATPRPADSRATRPQPAVPASTTSPTPDESDYQSFRDFQEFQRFQNLPEDASEKQRFQQWQEWQRR